MNSLDMTQFTEAKSDQINADDLIGGPRTITVSRVSQGSAEQPVNVNFEGDDGKPFRPCKTMRRVMVAIWGADAKNYVGKSMTIYRDPKVRWSGMEVGGIRISHMSDMDEPRTLALMVTRGKRASYKVMPLADAPKRKRGDPDAWAETFITELNAINNITDLDALAGNHGAALNKLKGKHTGIYERCANALERKRAELDPPANETIDDDWTDDQSGDWTEDGEADPVAAIEAMIAAASNKATWDKANAALNAADLPDAVADELAASLAAKMHELRGK
ncbi:MAG: hypothetical protein HKN38_06125 [Altererythrobacter sp.]|nr:hypothetical protein [Altererythrobacter sp.]